MSRRCLITELIASPSIVSLSLFLFSLSVLFNSLYTCLFLVWNVPDSWGAMGLWTVPLSTGSGGSAGSSRCEGPVTKGGRRRDKNESENARERQYSFVNGQKQCRISASTMRQLTPYLPPFSLHRCATFTVNVKELIVQLKISFSAFNHVLHI